MILYLRNIWFWIVGVIIAIAGIVLFLFYAPYLGAVSYLHQGFYITSPDVVVAGVVNTITWSVSDTNAIKYPTEKVEVCSGALPDQGCILIADAAKNNRSAQVKVPSTTPPGAAYLRMTARDAVGQLVAGASSAKMITVVSSTAVGAGDTIQAIWKKDAIYSAVKIEFCSAPSPTAKCIALASKLPNSGIANIVVPKSIGRTVGYIVVRNRTFAGLLIPGSPQYGSVKILKTAKLVAVAPSSNDEGSGGGGGGSNDGGGSSDQGPVDTPVVTEEPTPTPTLDPTDSPVPTDTPNPTETPTPTPSQTVEPTVTPENSPTPTVEPTSTPTVTPTASPSPTPFISSIACNGINVKDYGVLGDGKVDDTEAIKKALNASGTTLCFPAGIYRISAELNLSAHPTVISDAGAIIEQTCSTCISFTFSGPYEVFIRGMKFLGGRNQIAFTNDGSKNSSLHIVDSEFQASTGYAVAGTSGNVLPGTLKIERSKFVNSRKILRNSLASALVQDTWVSVGSKNFDTDSAAFWNISGASLVFDNMMGTPAMGESTDRLSAVRWVDNYGTFTAAQSRFGGEGGGMPAVYQYTGSSDSSTAVRIQDSQTSVGPTAQVDSAVVVLKSAIPHTIVLSANNFPIAVPYIISQGLSLASYIASHAGINIQIDANMAYPVIPDIPSELEKFTVRKK